MEKHCHKCNTTKPRTEFYKNNGRRGGLDSCCKTCRHAYDKTRSWPARDKRRIQQIKQLSVGYLRSHPCVDCGENDPVVLDYDHVRGIKKHNVSRLLAQARTWGTVLKEIAKCEVRCANCHRRKTHGHREKFADLAGLPVSPELCVRE